MKGKQFFLPLEQRTFCPRLGRNIVHACLGEGTTLLGSVSKRNEIPQKLAVWRRIQRGKQSWLVVETKTRWKIFDGFSLWMGWIMGLRHAINENADSVFLWETWIICLYDILPLNEHK